MPPRALHPSGIILVDKPAGPTSFAIVAAIAAADGGADGPRGDARPVRDRAPAAPVGRVDAAAAAVRRACRSATRPRSTSPRARRPATSRASASRSTTRPPRTSSRPRSTACAARSSSRFRRSSAVKIDGERAYALHRRGVAVEMPVRTMHVHELDARRSTRTASRGSTCSSPRGRTSARSPRRSAVTASSLRRTEIGPFRVDEADPERIIPPDDALARLA